MRKDEECTDTVAVFLRVDPEDYAHFRVTLGPQVQILAKATTSILCKSLEGVPAEEIMEIHADFVPKDRRRPVRPHPLANGLIHPHADEDHV